MYALQAVWANIQQQLSRIWRHQWADTVKPLLDLMVGIRDIELKWTWTFKCSENCQKTLLSNLITLFILKTVYFLIGVCLIIGQKIEYAFLLLKSIYRGPISMVVAPRTLSKSRRYIDKILSVRCKTPNNQSMNFSQIKPLMKQFLKWFFIWNRLIIP